MRRASGGGIRPHQQLYIWTPDGRAAGERVEAGTADSVLSLSGQSYVTVMA